MPEPVLKITTRSPMSIFPDAQSFLSATKQAAPFRRDEKAFLRSDFAHRSNHFVVIDGDRATVGAA